MGKKGGSSWLTAVKRAFRSPTKDTSQKKSSRRREETDQDEEEEKKREKRRWLFRKPSNNASLNHEAKAATTPHCAPRPPSKIPQLPPDHQSHAIAVAAATAAAAEAAVATAQAAVEIIRLTRSSNPTSSMKQNYAAIVIQTAFRGFLARRALVALKGIVKLQALIRGQNVRKQAKMTLKCMQALLRLQTRMRDHQARLSHDGGGGRKSMFVETTDLWDSRYLRDIRERKSLSKDRICIPDDWSTECSSTLEELEAALQAKKEAALKRESSLAYAFSQQAQMKIWDSEDGYEKEVIGDQERTNWLDKWMATKQWDTCSRGSTDKRDSIKTVEMDMNNNNNNIPGKQQSSSSSYSASPNVRKLQKHIPAASPRHRDRAALHNNCSYSMAVQPPVTPSPSRTRPMQAARPSSPRCLKEEKSYSISAANTPSLRAMQRLNSSISRYSISTNINDAGNHNNAASAANNNIIMPNYMAATESAKARVRSQSAPRQRASTPERERGGGLVGAKKRLSYPVPPLDQLQPNNNNNNGYGFTGNSYIGCTHNNLRSPSFKSLQAACLGIDLHSSNHSFYTDSIAGEISPCSTTDLRRWLR